MPILIALVVAVAVSAVLFTLVDGRTRAGDLADIRGAPAKVGARAAEKSTWVRRFVKARRDPSTETGLLLTISVGAIAVVIIIVGSLLEMVNKRAGFARWDDSAARFGASHATPDTTSFLKTVTTLGASWFAALLVLLVGIVVFIRTRKPTIFAFLATTVATVLIVNNVVKYFVDRQRPDIARLVGAHGSSFPSGHSAMAAGCYAALALVLGLGRSRRTRLFIAGAAFAVAVTVATTRVLLGVHWLTDVLAGLSVGWGCFALISIAFGGRVLHFGQPVETAQVAAETVTERIDGPAGTSSDGAPDPEHLAAPERHTTPDRHTTPEHDTTRV